MGVFKVVFSLLICSLRLGRSAVGQVLKYVQTQKDPIFQNGSRTGRTTGARRRDATAPRCEEREDDCPEKVSLSCVSSIAPTPPLVTRAGSKSPFFLVLVNDFLGFERAVAPPKGWGEIAQMHGEVCVAAPRQREHRRRRVAHRRLTPRQPRDSDTWTRNHRAPLCGRSWVSQPRTSTRNEAVKA